MHVRDTSCRPILIQIGQVLALLVIISVLWIGFIAVFNPHGPLGSRIIGAGFGMAALRDFLNVSSIIALVIVTMLLRRKTLGPALFEMGVLPFSWQGLSAPLLIIGISAALLFAFGHTPHFGSPSSLVAVSIVGTFVEEIVFRGFLFQQFRRWARVPFWPAAVISSIPFALVHLYQGSSIIVLVEVLAVTFTGGIVFCWLVERWGNLWAAWSLHAGFDFMFMIFSLGATAAGNRIGNVERSFVIILVIGATFILTRRRVAVIQGEVAKT